MKKILFILLLAAFLINCGTNPNNNNRDNSRQLRTTNYNIIVLLDLSDRILDGNQYKKDIDIIKTVLELFENNQLGRLPNSKDIFTIAIAPQKDSKIDDSQFNLSINMKGLSGSEFKTQKNKLLDDIKSLYEQAHAEAREKNPTGADIYGFFKNRLETHLKPSTRDDSFRNKMVILTDGYLAFDASINRPKGTCVSYDELNLLRNKTDWQKVYSEKKMGLQSFPIDTKDLDILMLEVAPKDPQVNINEMDILKKIWTNWFEDLGIYETEILQQEGQIQSIKNKILEFLEKKKHW